MDKERIYIELLRELESLLSDETDVIARMSSICSVLKSRLPYVSWVGFYRLVDATTLIVGPYQGEVGCLRITIGSGVCGTAAKSGRMQVVPDVHAFDGHIACDPDARSEIVIPIHDPNGDLIAVLDLDSHSPEAFDEQDRRHLEKICRELVVPPRS
jgi:GAF domain-containing protein